MGPHSHTATAITFFGLILNHFVVSFQVERQNIRVEKKPLVCEVMDIEEDPTFPLVTKKPKHPAVPPPGADATTLGGTAALDPDSNRVKSGSAEDSGVSTRGARTPGGAVPTASVSRKSHPTGPVSLKHTVEYINRPVDEVRLTVQWPPSSDGTTGSSSTSVSCDVSGVDIEVCGRTVYIAPGCAELKVPLPFALEPQGSRVQYDASGGWLEVQLRIQSVRGYLETMRSEKPLAFGQIGLGSDGLLELE